MAPEAAADNPNAVTVELSKGQLALIWPGLAYIVSAYQMERQGGTTPTSYPFVMYPPRRGFDSGTFSQPMMDRIISLLRALQPKVNAGGRFQLDSFELRAAAFAARTTLRLRRVRAREGRKARTRSQYGSNSEKRAIARQALRTGRLIPTLERYMKRAKRRFMLTASEDEFRKLSKEWQSHLRWIQFRLTYFKPWSTFFGVPMRKRYQQHIELLVKMAKDAIEVRRLKQPPAKDLRRVIRRFSADSHRGRIGNYDHVYMVTHSDSAVAKAKLFEYIEPRLYLERVS